jgi:hypothetical protein
VVAAPPVLIQEQDVMRRGFYPEEQSEDVYPDERSEDVAVPDRLLRSTVKNA